MGSGPVEVGSAYVRLYTDDTELVEGLAGAEDSVRVGLSPILRIARGLAGAFGQSNTELGRLIGQTSRWLGLLSRVERFAGNFGSSALGSGVGSAVGAGAGAIGAAALAGKGLATGPLGEALPKGLVSGAAAAAREASGLAEGAMKYLTNKKANCPKDIQLAFDALRQLGDDEGLGSTIKGHGWGLGASQLGGKYGAVGRVGSSESGALASSAALAGLTGPIVVGLIGAGVMALMAYECYKQWKAAPMLTFTGGSMGGTFSPWASSGYSGDTVSELRGMRDDLRRMNAEYRRMGTFG